MIAITLTPLYVLLGSFFAMIAWRALRDTQTPRPHARGAFFGLLALLFIAGDALPPVLAGVLVLAVAVIAGFGLPQIAPGAARPPSPDSPERELLWPILAIPALTVVLTLAFSRLQIDGTAPFTQQTAPLYALAIACALALILALKITDDGSGPRHSLGRSAKQDAARPKRFASPSAALARGGDLLETIGWAAFLPLLLAVLGTLFAQAGVGKALADLIGAWLPLDVRIVAILAYGLGMALLTMAMGNAFAAFPVIAGGIGLPYLVGVHGANPAPMAAIGMLCGYCGTLMTPMAANFNLVPVALLELSDRAAVIRAQIPTALPLLAANLVLLGLLCFR
jgi:uncharacterized membrane protein